MRQERHLAYFNLLDAFKEGCPLCYLVQKTASRYVDNLLYEQVNDPQTRQKIRKAKGFCNKHAWQIQKTGEALGISIIYEDLLKLSTAELHGERKKDKTIICLICHEERMTEKRNISILIENIQDHDLIETYESSFGLCLPHLSMVFENKRDNQAIKKIKNIELKKIDHLIEELEKLQQKYDYRFSKEVMGKEGTAWIRAIEKLNGKEGVF